MGLVIGGDIGITAVLPLSDLDSLKAEMSRLNHEFELVSNFKLNEFMNLKKKAYYSNDAFSFMVLNDNYNEIFFASDDFYDVEIIDKEIKIAMAEKTDEHISIKIRTPDLIDFKLSMLASLAICNLTDGIVDLIAFSNELYKFDKQRYTKEEWLEQIINIYEK